MNSIYVEKTIRKLRKEVTCNKEVSEILVRQPLSDLSYPTLFKNGNMRGTLGNSERSDISAQEDLEQLLRDVILEHKYIFDTFSISEKRKLQSVQVRWNNELIHHIFLSNGRTIISFTTGIGSYHFSKNKISISIAFKYTPICLIKYVLFHELLHIKFLGHSKKFHSCECQYDNYNRVLELLDKVLEHYNISRLTLSDFKRYLNESKLIIDPEQFFSQHKN